MVKLGINFDDVERAAQALQGQGQAVTVDTVRNYLGTGSNVTLGIYLKQWREQHSVNSLGLPDKLVSLVQDLYNHLQTESNQRSVDAVACIKHELESVKSNLDQVLQKNEQGIKEQDLLCNELKAVQQHNETLTEQVLNLNNELQIAQSSHMEQHNRIQSLQQQVLEFKAQQAQLQCEMELNQVLAEKLERLQLEKKQLEATLEGIKKEFSHIAWS